MKIYPSTFEDFFKIKTHFDIGFKMQMMNLIISLDIFYVKIDSYPNTAPSYILEIILAQTYIYTRKVIF